VDRRRPARPPRDDLGLLLGRELGKGERDRREIRAWIERPPELLEKDRLLDEPQSRAAGLLRDGHAEPAEPGEVAPRAGVPAGVGAGELGDALPREALPEERARLAPELVLLGSERELHHRDRGRPSTRSAMMLRSTSDVPASIVFPRLRSCRNCQ